MKPRAIVIFTQKFDLDADATILRLRSMGQLPARVNYDDSPKETYFDMSFSGDGRAGRLRTRNREIELGSIRSAYWRAPVGLGAPLGIASSDDAIAYKERNHAWHGLWSTEDCYWLNSPECARRSGWRLSQLKHASSCGFAVPRTLVTSQAPEAIAFCDSCGGRVLFRTLSDPLVPQVGEAKAPATPAQVILPTIVPIEHMKEGADQIEDAPCFFQEVIGKRLEIRVTVVGEELFVAEIESKEELRSPSDLERKDAPISVRKGALSDALQAQCLSLAKAYGLNYAVIDLILTPEGRYIFLEINPNGKFIHVEKRASELKITDAMAACLLRASN